MVKSFKADFRQGGQSILDDVYVRGCLYINGDCGIIFQDSQDSSKQSKLVVKNGKLTLQKFDSNTGGGSDSGSDDGSGIGKIVTVTQVGYAGTNYITVDDNNNISIGTMSNAHGTRYISTSLPPTNPSYCVDGDIYYYTGDD
tara:strand:- start:1047 stop:1472 length:426 start_codon:yes stop_codon:yes gene_type:complete